MDALDLSLWSAQGLLGLFFLAVGLPKVAGKGLDRWSGFDLLPRGLVVLVGVTEVLGAVALVVPMAAGSLTWTTPLAALGLGVTVLMAVGFHLRAQEALEALETALWAGICAVVVVGRWDQLVPDARVGAPWVLVAALGALVPAVVVNLGVLARRPVRTGAPGGPVDAGSRGPGPR
jgi:hypothetical protein